MTDDIFVGNLAFSDSRAKTTRADSDADSGSDDCPAHLRLHPDNPLFSDSHSLAIHIVGIVAAHSTSRVRARELLPYECGVEPIGDARDRFSVRFYIVAMLFLVFDVEVVFLFPWAIIYDKLAIFGLVEMLVFIGILVVGYYYAWRKGALEWA